MRVLGWVVAVLVGLGPSLCAEDSAGAAALQGLLEGNRRYVRSHLKHPHQDRKRRTAVASGQRPPAIVLSCADSRVPPEIVFDQGLGDLFVIRVAGNVVDDHILGSIEYAVEHLGAQLIMVLGHERCGAVTAALEPGEPHDHVASLLASIRAALPAEKGADPVDTGVRANVLHSVGLLSGSEPVLAPACRAHKLQVVGARYDLDSGEVELLKPTATR
jgi:carbonic anhydrase